MTAQGQRDHQGRVTPTSFHGRLLLVPNEFIYIITQARGVFLDPTHTVAGQAKVFRPLSYLPLLLDVSRVRQHKMDSPYNSNTSHCSPQPVAARTQVDDWPLSLLAHQLAFDRASVSTVVCPVLQL